MATKQINLKIPSNLYSATKDFADSYGYRSIQELVAESIREKIFERSEFDESFSEKEIGLIDTLAEKSLRKKKTNSEKALLKALE